MVNLNRRATQPLKVKRSNRVHNIRGLTSMPAGKMVPLAAVPLLREDGVRSGRVRVSLEMMETVEILLNSVNVRVMAYLVPTLALDRFQGSMDVLNRSFKGEPPLDGETVIPFIETHEFRKGETNNVDRPVYKYLGLHAKGDDLVNTMYLEAYNQIWNFRASNRSKELSPRERLADDLAPAFWVHEQFAHIVPDFDQAVIDGEVALNVVESKLPVAGLGIRLPQSAVTQTNVRSTDGTTADKAGWSHRDSPAAGGHASFFIEQGDTGYPAIFAELADNGITVSLSNIELAKKTRAFAKLRQQYEGHDDEWLIDMLMSGLSVPDQALKQPMLLADKRVPFRMAKRYASDGESLTESVVNGVAQVDLSIRLPRLATGGVIMIVAEATPDQLFERQEDVFLHMATQPSDAGSIYPDYLRDELDPEKVEIVTNSMIDCDHEFGTDTFGYAPLNWRWNYQKPTVGGRYYRPEVDAGFDEARQRIWAVETENPTLAEDFYLCTQMHQKPFVVTDQDPFEAVTVGALVINGNTVFGHKLIDASESYDKVLEKAPQDRIQKQVDGE